MTSLTLMAAICVPQLAIAVVFLVLRYIARAIRRRRTIYPLVKDRERPSALAFRRMNSIGRTPISDKCYASANIDQD